MQSASDNNIFTLRACSRVIIAIPSRRTKERPFFTINFEVGFDDYYLIEREIEIKDLSLQYDEVQQVKWASREEILQLIEEGKFIDYWFTDLLFDMRKHRGGHKPKQFAYTD